MRIAVLVKHVPNPTGIPPEIGPDHRLRREEAPDAGLDPSSEPALAVACEIADAHGGHVIAVSMGPPTAIRTVRRALAIGAHEGVLVADPRLRGADTLATAHVLAAAIEPLDADLVLAGVESTDGACGTVPATVAELLGLPSATFARAVSIEGGLVTIERETLGGYDEVRCSLPALISVTAAAARTRHVSAKDLVRAKKREIGERDLQALGIALSVVLPGHAVTSVEFASERGAAGEIIHDRGHGIDRVVSVLTGTTAA